MKVNEKFKETSIGLIPTEWEITQIGDVSRLITKGSTPTTYGFSFENSGINFIKIEALDDSTGKIRINVLAKISDKCHAQFSRSQLKENDILFAIAGAIGKCIIIPASILPTNTNQALAIIRLSDSILPKYVYYQLKGNLIQSSVTNMKTTTAQANISLEQVSGFLIPLPPLHEQQKIADILSTVDEHISETESLIEKTKVLKQGMMQRLLTQGIGHTEFKDTEIGRIPAEWEVVKLGKITRLITKGSTPTTYGFDFEDDGINFIKIEALDDSSGKIKTDVLAKINDKCHEQFFRSQLRENDILFAIAGAIGKCVIIPENILPANTNQALAIIRLSDNIYPRYIYYQLKGNLIQTKVNLIKTTTAQANISLEQVSGFMIPLPPLHEQNKIITILTTIDDHIDTYQSKLTALIKLKSGLMQQLLTGKIRVKV